MEAKLKFGSGLLLKAFSLLYFQGILQMSYLCTIVTGTCEKQFLKEMIRVRHSKYETYMMLYLLAGWSRAFLINICGHQNPSIGQETRLHEDSTCNSSY